MNKGLIYEFFRYIYYRCLIWHFLYTKYDQTWMAGSLVHWCTIPHPSREYLNFQSCYQIFEFDRKKIKIYSIMLSNTYLNVYTSYLDTMKIKTSIKSKSIELLIIYINEYDKLLIKK